MRLGRKRSAAIESNEQKTSRRRSVGKRVAKKRKKNVKSNEIEFVNLPSNIINKIIGNLSVQDHANFRSTCRFIHEEVEAYWRTRKFISVPDLLKWFPNLEEKEKWKLQSIATLTSELQAVFNLLKKGNLNSLSLAGIRSLSFINLFQIIGKATCNTVIETLINLKELDVRGCIFKPSELIQFAAEVPNLKILIIDDLISTPKKLLMGNIKKEKYRISNIPAFTNSDLVSSFPSSQIGIIPSHHQNIIEWINASLPMVQHFFIENHQTF